MNTAKTNEIMTDEMAVAQWEQADQLAAQADAITQEALAKVAEKTAALREKADQLKEASKDYLMGKYHKPRTAKTGTARFPLGNKDLKIVTTQRYVLEAGIEDVEATIKETGTQAPIRWKAEVDVRGLKSVDEDIQKQFLKLFETKKSVSVSLAEPKHTATKVSTKAALRAL